MNVEAEPFVGYGMSSQQCAAHVDDWQERAPVHALLVEGAASDMKIDALREALDRAIERHEILRTCYRAVVGLRYPIQRVSSSLAPAWKVFEMPADDESLIRAARAMVNPSEGPVIGAALATAPDGKLRWALAAPVYSLDGTALQALILECVTMCAMPRPKADLSIDVVQYPDYVAWQRELLAAEVGREGVQYWETQAGIAEQSSRLPFETGSTNAGCESACTPLTEAAEAAVAKLVERSGVPVETVMLASWASFMARVTQTSRLSFDWHVDVRVEELRGALGCFVTRLPVLLELGDEMPMEAVLRSVDSQLQIAASWKECFDAAAYDDHLAKRGAVRCGIEFACLRMLDLPNGWKFKRIELDPGRARLKCLCIGDGGKQLLCWQATENLLPGTLQTWMRQFMTLLESAGEHPEQSWTRLSLLGHVEREHILRVSGAHRERSERNIHTLHGLFEAQVRRVPESLAVVCGEARLTYGDLDRHANAVARCLRSYGIGLEQRVGVYFGRSTDAITAMLAVLKSGGAYVPLDPAYPAPRIDDMIADAGISIVIGSTHDRARFSDAGLQYVCIDESDRGVDAPLSEPEIEPRNLAYVIYTSGSTGKPKGVMVSHENAVASTLARFGFYEASVSRFLLLSSTSFDSSAAGIYWTLGQGGTLYLPTEGMQHDPAHIAKLIAREKISTLLALPSLYKQILESLADGVGLKCAVVAGEPCHGDVVELHRRKLPAAAIVNEYGPTEGTVWSNAFRIGTDWAAGSRVPIGRPIDSMYGYVLDGQLQFCPVGLPGEWYIGGEGIARGYAGMPALTAQRFVADPLLSGRRLYRTGDRARLRPDGEVEYLGRNDGQVKLRGYRIELDEIESALRSHRYVRDAAAFMHEDNERGPRLAACFVMIGAAADAGQQPVREELLAHLRRTLPAFMIPTHLISVASLPRLANGKVDRRALVALLDRESRAPYIAPGDDVERALTQIWQDVLKVERVGVADNFFDLGGHSLLVAQVSSRARQALAVDLPLKDIFEATTLSELARRVRAIVATSHDELTAMETIMAEDEE